MSDPRDANAATGPGRLDALASTRPVGHGDIGATAPGRYGATPPRLEIVPLSIASAWNLQGDAKRASFADVATAEFGLRLPTVPNTVARGPRGVAIWLGPRSWLLATGGPDGFTAFATRRAAFNAQGGALFDVSASRVAWRVGGSRAAALLAKYCPLDFDPSAFPPGGCAQSVFGHLNALYTRSDDGAWFDLWVARSFARDVWHALTDSAAQDGYELRAPIPL